MSSQDKRDRDDRFDNLDTHKSAWRDAIVVAKNHAVEDKEYWQHELHAFDRTFEDLALEVKSLAISDACYAEAHQALTNVGIGAEGEDVVARILLLHQRYTQFMEAVQMRVDAQAEMPVTEEQLLEALSTLYEFWSNSTKDTTVVDSVPTTKIGIWNWQWPVKSNPTARLEKVLDIINHHRFPEGERRAAVSCLRDEILPLVRNYLEAKEIAAKFQAMGDEIADEDEEEVDRMGMRVAELMGFDISKFDGEFEAPAEADEPAEEQPIPVDQWYHRSIDPTITGMVVWNGKDLHRASGTPFVQGLPVERLKELIASGELIPWEGAVPMNRLGIPYQPSTPSEIFDLGPQRAAPKSEAAINAEVKQTEAMVAEAGGLNPDYDPQWDKFCELLKEKSIKLPIATRSDIFRAAKDALGVETAFNEHRGRGPE